MNESSRVPMRMLPPAVAITTFDEVFLGYSEDEAVAEARRVLDMDLADAAVRCPFDVDIPRFARQVAERDFDAALATIREAHPWPEVLGRHCHKFCERIHTHQGVEAPFLSALEWAVGRYGDPARSPFAPGTPTGRRVAVIGAGSGGLACAWSLRRLGHTVDVFESTEVPSGLLFNGYPSFRMNKQVALREHQPAEWGARLELNRTIGPEELPRLVADYDAVFVAVGLTPVRQLGIEGDDLEGVWTGLDLLRDIWYGHPPSIGPRAVVVGAGYTAIDVVRAAVRLGCSTVEMVYRRGVDEMPLNPGRNSFFVSIVEREGVRCTFMTSPTRILGKQGRVTGIELVKMEYGPTDADGRPSVRPIPGSEYPVEADTVIRAVGEGPDAEALVGPVGLAVTEQGFIGIDPITRQTSNPKVWAGGDIVGSLGNDGAAVDGFWAAGAINASFRGELATWREQRRVKDMSH